MSLFDAYNSFLNSLPTSDIPIESPIASPRDNSGTGTFSTSQGPQTPSQLSDLLNSMGVQTTFGEASNTMQQVTQQASDAMQQGAQSLSTQLQTAASLSGSSWLANLVLTNRMVSAIIGLICIAAGLFMFQHTRELVVSGAKTAAKLAA